jgi:hypothetical protein
MMKNFHLGNGLCSVTVASRVREMQRKKQAYECAGSKTFQRGALREEWDISR